MDLRWVWDFVFHRFFRVVLLKKSRGLDVFWAFHSAHKKGFEMRVTKTGWWFGTFFYFPIYWVSNHPNWLSYFSEGWPNHQPEKKPFFGVANVQSIPVVLHVHMIPPAASAGWCSFARSPSRLCLCETEHHPFYRQHFGGVNLCLHVAKTIPTVGKSNPNARCGTLNLFDQGRWIKFFALKKPLKTI